MQPCAQRPKRIASLVLSWALPAAAALLAAGCGGGGQQPEPPNPVPTLTLLTPASAVASGAAFTLRVNGTGFASSSVVRWNGSARITTFISTTELQAAILATDIAAAGAAQVTVFNSAPGGGTSNVLTFTINSCTRGVTERVSVAGDGSEANEESSPYSAVSADGSFVAFTSFASNLVSGDTNRANDVFVRDTCRGAVGCSPTTVRVSVASDGAEGNNVSAGPLISADGRFVAFSSAASNLVPGDTNSLFDAFVHDRDADHNGIFDESCAGCRKTVRVSVASDGSQLNLSSGPSSISPTGRFVGFESFPPSGSNFNILFVHDRDADNNGIFDETCPGCRKTVEVSVASDGTEANNFSGGASLSADGRFVAFGSLANNLVPGDINGVGDVFVHDRDADHNGIFDETCTGCRKTVRASVASNGIEGNGNSGGTSISADGRFVAFLSSASNLVPGDTNLLFDAFVHDRDADNNGLFDETCTGCRKTVRVSVASNGTEANDANFDTPSITANGRLVVFTSQATNLVPGDTNAALDVFIHDRDADDDGFFDEPGAIATVRVSVASDGSQGVHGSFSGTISADSRWVAFFSNADNFVPGDTFFFIDVFLAQICLQ